MKFHKNVLILFFRILPFLVSLRLMCFKGNKSNAFILFSFFVPFSIKIQFHSLPSSGLSQDKAWNLLKTRVCLSLFVDERDYPVFSSVVNTHDWLTIFFSFLQTGGKDRFCLDYRLYHLGSRIDPECFLCTLLMRDFQVNSPMSSDDHGNKKESRSK